MSLAFSLSLSLSLPPSSEMGDQGDSPTSIESSSHACISTASLSQSSTGDLRTELKLGLSLSINSQTSSSSSREQHSDRPPRTERLLRSTPNDRRIRHHPASFFVKVHMEGIPVGRKLDLIALDGYDSLIRTLRCMFRTNISCPGIAQVFPRRTYQLIYEDMEGDWMMVGDVPWELFLNNVKRLKIAKPDKC
ncbi:auxin-responsive protein IAA31 isoform X1 [Phoenix dactylifera]|uniref:Auxin-responsive protein n=1 Tax=Phoenix dactylifera TaxID=42345 RepID=A0A8B7CWX3_PHODC|nr:auxin-responsive protein IAA31 isoform X1 [Phoenix dactylifera]